MKERIERILSKWFPVRLPKLDPGTVIVEKQPHPLTPQHPPLRDEEMGVQNLREHDLRNVFRNGIERIFHERQIEEAEESLRAYDRKRKARR